MRADMAKVLVERPRPGSRAGSRPAKGYRRRVARGLADPDGLPAREGIQARYTDRRPFNENLAPLRRFLRTNLGRPWAAVSAELHARIDPGNVVQKHVLTHLWEFVVRHVVLIDGRPCRGDGWRHGEPLAADRGRFGAVGYVCPATGLFKPLPAGRPARRKPAPRIVWSDGRRAVGRTAAGWELLTLTPLPPATLSSLARWRATDVWLGQRVDSWEHRRLAALYGRPVYAVARRPVGRRELMRLPVPVAVVCPLAAPNRVR